MQKKDNAEHIRLSGFQHGDRSRNCLHHVSSAILYIRCFKNKPFLRQEAKSNFSSTHLRFRMPLSNIPWTAVWRLGAVKGYVINPERREGRLAPKIIFNAASGVRWSIVWLLHWNLLFQPATDSFSAKLVPRLAPVQTAKNVARNHYGFGCTG